MTEVRAAMHKTIRVRRYPAVAAAIYLHHGHLAGCSRPRLSPRSRGMSSATSPVKRRRRYPKTAAACPRPRRRLGRLVQSARQYAALSSVCCTALLGRRTPWMDGWHRACTKLRVVGRVLLFIVRRRVIRYTPRCNSTPMLKWCVKWIDVVYTCAKT